MKPAPQPVAVGKRWWLPSGILAGLVVLVLTQPAMLPSSPPIRSVGLKEIVGPVVVAQQTLRAPRLVQALVEGFQAGQPTGYGIRNCPAATGNSLIVAFHYNNGRTRRFTYACAGWSRLMRSPVGFTVPSLAFRFTLSLGFTLPGRTDRLLRQWVPPGFQQLIPISVAPIQGRQR